MRFKGESHALGTLLDLCRDTVKTELQKLSMGAVVLILRDLRIHSEDVLDIAWTWNM